MTHPSAETANARPSLESTELNDPVTRLGAVEKGLLAGLFLAQGGHTDFDAVDGIALEARLAGLAESVREGLVEVVGWLREQDREQRAGRLARIVRGLVAPTPPGLGQIHFEWVEDALLAASPVWWPCLLAALPSVHRPVLERLMTERAAAEQEASLTAPLPLEGFPASHNPDGASTAESFDAESAAAIVRGVLAVLTPMEKGDGSEEAEAWLAFESARFEEEVLSLGAMALGHSLAGADVPVLERAALPFGEPWTTRIRVAAEVAVEASVRATSRACLVALPPMTSARATLLAIGGTALGFRLRNEPDIVRRRLAQRLPRAAGERLLRMSEPASGKA